jgi:hypothetical protein
VHRAKNIKCKFYVYYFRTNPQTPSDGAILDFGTRRFEGAHCPIVWVAEMLYVDAAVVGGTVSRLHRVVCGNVADHSYGRPSLLP